MKIDRDEQYAHLLRSATRASFMVALILILSKAWVWFQSGSVTVLAGLADSILDGVASLASLVAARYALRPADDDHRFGHGKAEALAAMGQCFLIVISAFFVGWHSIQRLNNPEAIQRPELGVGVMLFSLILTLGLLVYQSHVLQLTKSTLVKADAMHYRSDLFLNTGIVFALVLDWIGFKGLDPIFGLTISGYILYGAVQIGFDATKILMDQEISSKDRDIVIAIATQNPLVMGVHDVRSRVSGRHWFIQMHAELPFEMTLVDAHLCCDQIEKNIKQAYPQADVIVHPDPFDPHTQKVVSQAVATESRKEDVS